MKSKKKEKWRRLNFELFLSNQWSAIHLLVMALLIGPTVIAAPQTGESPSDPNFQMNYILDELSAKKAQVQEAETALANLKAEEAELKAEYELLKNNPVAAQAVQVDLAFEETQMQVAKEAIENLMAEEAEIKEEYELLKNNPVAVRAVQRALNKSEKSINKAGWIALLGGLFSAGGAAVAGQAVDATDVIQALGIGASVGFSVSGCYMVFKKYNK